MSTTEKNLANVDYKDTLMVNNDYAEPTGAVEFLRETTWSDKSRTFRTYKAADKAIKPLG